jgi:5-methylcytosine-specific restriction protein B
MDKEKIIQKHNEILTYFLEYKEKNKDFTFATRVRNTQNRLSEGFWFLGTESYIFVPLYKVGSINMTKTIGFVYTENKQSIEIVFRGMPNMSSNEKEFYNDIVSYLENNNNLKKDKSNLEQYSFTFLNNDLKENLIFYIDSLRKKCNTLLKKYGLFDKYIYNEETFQKNLKKVLASKDKKTTHNLSVKKGKVMDDNLISKPLNQILYGPPGTGKTYNTINKALEIIFNINTINKEEKDIESELVIKATEIIDDKENKINIDIDKKDDKREKLKKVFDFFIQ